MIIHELIEFIPNLASLRLHTDQIESSPVNIIILLMNGENANSMSMLSILNARLAAHGVHDFAPYLKIHHNQISKTKQNQRDFEQ